MSEPAFVLHHWDYSESSLVLDLFTRAQGRVAALAKGAKRPSSQLRPALMPFQRLQVQLSRPKAVRPLGEADPVLLLKAADFAGRGGPLPSARLLAGFYLNEWLLKLLARGDPHETLFDGYADSLAAMVIAADDEALARLLRAFELLLLAEIGLLPDLAVDTTTQQALRAERRYRLQPDLGLIQAGDGAGLPAPRWLALAQGLARARRDGGLTALRAAIEPADASALKPALRGLLAYHAGSPRLRTRQLMRQVQALCAPPAEGTPAQAAAP